MKLLIFIMLFLFCGTIFADRGLTKDELKILKNSQVEDKSRTALTNSVSNNSIKDLVVNRSFINEHETFFDHEIKTASITNQKRTGRCWLFAALNIIRPAFMKKNNVKSIEFSQNYLFFWDKMEKANYFLESILSLSDKDWSDVNYRSLMKTPIPDGGWWSYAVHLIEKYGVIPQEAMKETKNSENSGQMNKIISSYLKKSALELRKLKNQDTTREDLSTKKIEVLKNVYRLLTYCLGTPPENFNWRYKDKDDKLVEKNFKNPKEFYEKTIDIKISDYYSIFDHPAYPYEKYYQVNYCVNMANTMNMDFINLDIRQLKDFTLKSLLDSVPVWFASDVGKGHDSDQGIFSCQLYDYESLLNIDCKMSKKQRIMTFNGTPNHAMVFLGVDTLANGDPKKWLVENSWGASRGKNGYWSLYDDWFDEHVYCVIIHKDYLPKKVKDLRKTKPSVIPAWDPTRRFFY